MDKEDYKRFLNVLQVTNDGLETDLDTRSFFFETENSNSFQREYDILIGIKNLIDKIMVLIDE